MEFLERHGVPGALLREAERRAERNGTAPSEELPPLGIDGRRYGSLLADDLGIAFLDDLSGATPLFGTGPLAADAVRSAAATPLFGTGPLAADAVRSAAATLARLREGTVLVLAPQPHEIALLRGRLRAMPALAERLRIATPEAIRTLIASRRYPALVHYAVHRLVRVLPRLSSGSERWKGVHGHKKLAAALLALGLVAPLATVDSVWFLFTLFFLNCNFWRLAAAFRQARPLRVEPVPDARLTYALAFARGDYVAVFDAEDRPEPDQLRKAAAAFRERPDLGCVQARLTPDNGGSWLARMFAVEYAANFEVLLPALAGWGVPLPLGGTSNHFPGIM